MVEGTDKGVSIAIFSRSHWSLGLEDRVNTTDCEAINELALDLGRHWVGQERAQSAMVT